MKEPDLKWTRLHLIKLIGPLAGCPYHRSSNEHVRLVHAYSCRASSKFLKTESASSCDKVISGFALWDFQNVIADSADSDSLGKARICSRSRHSSVSCTSACLLLTFSSWDHDSSSCMPGSCWLNCFMLPWLVLQVELDQTGQEKMSQSQTIGSKHARYDKDLLSMAAETYQWPSEERMDRIGNQHHARKTEFSIYTEAAARFKSQLTDKASTSGISKATKSVPAWRL